MTAFAQKIAQNGVADCRCRVPPNWKIRKVFRSFYGKLQGRGRGCHEWVVPWVRWNQLEGNVLISLLREADFERKNFVQRYHVSQMCLSFQGRSKQERNTVKICCLFHSQRSFPFNTHGYSASLRTYDCLVENVESFHHTKFVGSSLWIERVTGTKILALCRPMVVVQPL